MAFVRKKIMRGKPYLQLVENQRVDGKVKQRVILHIGAYKSPEEAVGCWEAGTEWTPGKANTWFRERRRTYTYAPRAAEKVNIVRQHLALDEQAVAAERAAAAEWKAAADVKMAALIERMPERV
jgi:hypothetical protein